MSRWMNSPSCTPASYSPATRSTGSLEDVTSSTTSGKACTNYASFGKSTVFVAVLGMMMRMRPDGVSPLLARLCDRLLDAFQRRRDLSQQSSSRGGGRTSFPF